MKIHRLAFVQLLVSWLLFLATPAVAQKYAPLPKQITEAKTVYLLNQTIEPKVADKAYKELQSWGHFEVVDDMEKADLVFRFRHPSSDAFFIVPLGTGVVGGSIQSRAVRLDIFDPKTSREFPIWSITKGGTWLVSNSGKDCIKELRKRFPEEKKNNNKE